MTNRIVFTGFVGIFSFSFILAWSEMPANARGMMGGRSFSAPTFRSPVMRPAAPRPAAAPGARAPGSRLAPATLQPGVGGQMLAHTPPRASVISSNRTALDPSRTAFGHQPGSAGLMHSHRPPVRDARALRFGWPFGLWGGAVVYYVDLPDYDPPASVVSTEEPGAVYAPVDSVPGPEAYPRLVHRGCRSEQQKVTEESGGERVITIVRC